MQGLELLLRCGLNKRVRLRLLQVHVEGIHKILFNILQEFTPFKVTEVSKRYRRPLKKLRTSIDNDVHGDEEDGEEQVVAQQAQVQQPLVYQTYKVGMQPVHEH